MRVTTAFNRLLRLEGVNVAAVDIGHDTVTVEVALRRRRLACPECGFTTRARYDIRPVASTWRHLRLGTCKLVVTAQLRRLACPEHGVRVEGVPFAMGPAFRKSVTTPGHAPQATICIDPFHAVKLVTDALNVVRRDLWQQLRQLPDPDIAKKFKGARWALLKNPEDLTDRQADTLTTIRRHGGALWRGYQLKEAFRAIFAGDLDVGQAAELLDRWCSWAQRCRLAPFVKAQRTVRKHREGILAAIRLGLTNARLEGLNQRVRLILRRAFGFHSAKAALALVMLSAGPIDLRLPWEPAA
ncbi:MAG: transposase [Actinomycetes bacterium]